MSLVKKYAKLCADLSIAPLESLPESLQISAFKVIPKLKPTAPTNVLAVAALEWLHAHPDATEKTLALVVKALGEHKGEADFTAEAATAVAAAAGVVTATVAMTPEAATALANAAADALGAEVDNADSLQRRGMNTARALAKDAPFDPELVRNALRAVAEARFPAAAAPAADAEVAAKPAGKPEDVFAASVDRPMEEVLAAAFCAVPEHNDIPPTPWVAPADAATPVEAAYRQWLEDIAQDPRGHELFLEAHAPHDGVVTRFPPEPNGFLHIGHAKAMLLDFGFAKVRGGITYLRFDDTNPKKEDQEFVDSIIEDMEWLGHRPYRITYTSDYFDRLYRVAEYLIQTDRAYVCFLNAETMSEQRAAGIESPTRNTDAATNLALFRAMRAGRFAEGECVLRLKIDMSSPDGVLRDPVAYRIIYLPHHHVGDNWCIYPSYDMSHCLIDAYEHITHSMCTLEFNTRRPCYHWLTGAALGYRPMQWEMGKLVLTNSVTSKRCINHMIKIGAIRGYDDPRLPTLHGLRRRGYTADIVNRFVAAQGFTRNDGAITPLWALDTIARAIFNKNAPRALAVLEPVPVRLTGAPASAQIAVWPGATDAARAAEVYEAAVGECVYVDRADVDGVKDIVGHAVCLRNGPVIRFTSAETNSEGRVVALTAECVPADEMSTTLRWHWAGSDSVEAEIREFDLLFRTRKVDTFFDKLAGQINPDSCHIFPHARVPAHVAAASIDDRFQFQRLGYYALDRVDTTPERPVFNRVCSISMPKPFFTGVRDAAGAQIFSTYTGELTAVAGNGARRAVSDAEFIELQAKN